ncbi:MAG: hypothetical protein KJ950_15205 [Proteobacteria bacterium]|nr:hypothetical protein [Pseudomonadota bacterium]MBU1688684.1 hypothetical protein [Pseudomonadota bacterium]
MNNYFSHGRAMDYHITNITIHLLSFFALLFFLKQLLRIPLATGSLKSLTPPFLIIAVAGLWALNPVQTNAVTYIVQRMAAICALFYLLCLGLYIKGRLEASPMKAVSCYIGALLAAICAFLSKENSATLPLAILLLEDIFISPGSIHNFLLRSIKRHWLPITIILILVLPLFQFPWENRILGGYNSREFSLTERLLTEGRIVVWYISLLFLPLPSRMNLDHDILISQSLFSPITTLFSILLLGSLLLSAYRIRHKFPLMSFGILFFFLTMVIESSIIPLELMFEHRLYLPSVGLILALLSLTDLSLFFLPNLKTTELQNILTASLIVLLTGCSILTTLRNNSYRDSVTIYADMARKSPNKPRTLNNYGMALAKDNRLEEASIVLNKSFEIGQLHNEAFYATINNLLLINKQNDGTEEAILEITELMGKVPRYAGKSHLDRLSHNLAYSYFQINQFDKAFDNIKEALRLFSHDRNSLSVALCMKIIGSAYNDPIYRAKLALQGETSQEAVLLKTIDILIGIHDYPKVMELNAKLAETNPEKANYYDLVLREIQEKNQSSFEAAQLGNAPEINNNFPVRWRLQLAQFFQKYYRPLSPLVPILLNQAEQLAPANPHVKLMQLQLLIKKDPDEARILLVDKLIPTYPDFTPFLLIGFQLLNGQYYDLAYQIGTHLLDIYPDAPGWENTSLFITTYGKYLTKDD